MTPYYADDLVTLYREMLPYLRVKKAQALLALAFRATFPDKPTRHAVDEWLLAERDAYCDAMREAKRLEYA